MSEMKFLELHGDRVAYQDVGSGPEALLLIHGMAGSSETWRAVIPQLSRNYRVVAPDLLGHGQSAKPRGDYSLGAFAVWLRDLLDELGISRATIVGQSLGERTRDHVGRAAGGERHHDRDRLGRIGLGRGRGAKERDACEHHRGAKAFHERFSRYSILSVLWVASQDILSITILRRPRTHKPAGVTHRG